MLSLACGATLTSHLSGLSELCKANAKDMKTQRGTAGYMAPEAHQNLPVNEKTDVFAFAMVRRCCGRCMWRLHHLFAT